MEYIVDTLFNLLTAERIATVLFQLILLIIVYVTARRSGAGTTNNDDKANPSAYGPGITIINNVLGGRSSGRKRIRRRRIEQICDEVPCCKNADTDSDTDKGD